MMGADLCVISREQDKFFRSLARACPSIKGKAREICLPTSVSNSLLPLPPHRANVCVLSSRMSSFPMRIEINPSSQSTFISLRIFWSHGT